jgi:hypothetical protein
MMAKHRDKDFEKKLCADLLAITRLIYACMPINNLPSVDTIMKKHEEESPDEIRKEIQENLDFLRVWVKYLLFDNEATLRETKGK